MNVSLPIRELADMLCSRSARRKVIILLRAYFDDTGTHRDSHVVGVAGLIGEVSDWTSLEATWSAKLTDYGLEDFHAAACANAAPEYGHLREAGRDALVRELANIIVGHDLLPVSAAVHTESWRSVVVNDRFAADFLEQYKKPFFLCFEHCVRMGSHWSRQFQSASPFAVIFNEQGIADKEMAGEIFDAYQQSKLWGGQLSALAFAPRKGCAPLQAADFVAYEAYQSWHDIARVPERHDRPAMEILGKKEDFLHSFVFRDLELINEVKTFHAGLRA